jgi:hypothetical protein
MDIFSLLLDLFRYRRNQPIDSEFSVDLSLYLPVRRQPQNSEWAQSRP